MKPHEKTKDELAQEDYHTMRKVLESYSEFLEQRGYLDTDWRTEHPSAIEEFIKLKLKYENIKIKDLSKR